MALKIFALIVILVLIAAAIWIVVKLGNLPGQLAKNRDHPQTEAIQILGWIGLLTLGVGWLVAIVWAYMKPLGNSEELVALRQRVEQLENRLTVTQAEPDA